MLCARPEQWLVKRAANRGQQNVARQGEGRADADNYRRTEGQQRRQGECRGTTACEMDDVEAYVPAGAAGERGESARGGSAGSAG